MTDIPDVVIKRLFEKLDNIDKVLHEQCHRISKLESMNVLINIIWKKIVASVAVVGGLISILVILK